MARIAVAGATGRVGRYVVDVLESDGHEVVAISRSQGVDVITGDGLAAALVVSTPFTVVVWFVSSAMSAGVARLADLPRLFLPVLSVSIVLIAINMLIAMRRSALCAGR